MRGARDRFVSVVLESHESSLVVWLELQAWMLYVLVWTLLRDSC